MTDERRDSDLFGRIVYTLLLLVSLLSSVYGAQVGDIISNSANLSYTIEGIDKNSTTNEVNLSISETNATIEFLEDISTGAEQRLEATEYIDGGGVAHSMPPARLSDGTTATPPADIHMNHTDTYYQEDLVIIRVTDIDRDTNVSTQESIEINVTDPATGDTETLILHETNSSSGVFIGYLHTDHNVTVSGDGNLTVAPNDQISAIYMDNSGAQEIRANAVIVAASSDLIVSKSQSKDVASVGEYVKYTVNVENVGTVNVRNVLIEDMLPHGVKYVKGSLKIDGATQIPQISADGRIISYQYPLLSAGATVQMSYVALITAGIIDGKATNRAWATTAGDVRSNTAKVTLIVKEELYRSKGFILGQVYDANITRDTNHTADSNSSVKYGIEGIKLYMEDGRYVLTDKQGKYHFMDVANGTHVVQMDEESFRGRYKLAKCKSNTRFAGSSRSQFVDLYHGELARVDFCLERIVQHVGKSTLALHLTKLAKRELQLQISVGSDATMLDPEVFITMPPGVEYIKGSASSPSEPQQEKDMLMIKTGGKSLITLKLRTVVDADPDKEIRAILYYDTRLAKDQHSDIAEVMFTTHSAKNADIVDILEPKDSVEIVTAGAKTPIGEGDYNWTKPTHQIAMPEYTPEEVDALGQKPAIVWPPKGWIPDIPSTRVAVLYPKRTRVTLKLNGKKVSPLNYEGIFRDSKRKMMIMHYKGVDLKEKENIFEAVIKSRDGKIISRLQRKIFVESRAPVRLEYLPDYSYLVADGKHSPVIAVKFIGPSGHVLRGGMVGSYTTDSRHTPLISNNGKGQYTIDSQGIAYIKLKPTTVTGETSLRFELADRKRESITIRLKPYMRKWIMVGFAEGTIGYNTLHGHRESLEDKNIDERWYTEGRVAFFAKGRIKGNWLMTMSYDSGKKEGDRELFDKIDPNAYYTIYQDASSQKNETPSRKKLYLKLEKDAVTVLFGDYSTGLTKTELSKYSRSFTGFKGEYHGANIDATLFAAESGDVQFRDEIRGDGTRGYYQLSRSPIIKSSEHISIIVKDKYRDEIILDRIELERYHDYDIDYDKGTLYFKNVIHSTDIEFNPQYIVAVYELDSENSDQYTYGGRVSVKSDNGKSQWGVTAIKEETGRGNNLLYGIDSTIKIGEKTTFTAEIAESRVDVDGNITKGDAVKAELEYKDTNLSIKAYYRKQDNSFGLGQLSKSLEGTRKAGLDASKKISKKWSLSTTLYQNRNYDVNSSTDNNVLELKANYSGDIYKTSVGYRYAKSTGTAATDQITTKVSRSYKDGKIKAWISHDQSIGSNEDETFPVKTAVGLDYRLDKNLTITGVMERVDGSSGVDWHSLFGLKYKPWQDENVTLLGTLERTESGDDTAWHTSTGIVYEPSKDMKVTYRRLYDSDQDGSQLYDTLGVSRTLVFGERWKWKLGYEKGVAWDENSSSDKEFDAIEIGMKYTGEKYSADTSLGYRHSGIEEKLNLDTGLYIKKSEAVGFAFALSYHNIWDNSSKDRDIDAKAAFVYRPSLGKWIILERLDLVDNYTKDEADESQTQKLINNLHLNWQPNDIWEFGLHYGLKHVIDEIDEVAYSSWTDLIGLNARYDIGKKWSIGVQGSILHSYTGENIDYGAGVFVSTTPWENAELTLGYNIEGFDDDDFSQQNYYHEGPYLRIRMKFDQESVKSLVRGAIK